MCAAFDKIEGAATSLFGVGFLCARARVRGRGRVRGVMCARARVRGRGRVWGFLCAYAQVRVRG